MLPNLFVLLMNPSNILTCVVGTCFRLKVKSGKAEEEISYLGCKMVEDELIGSKVKGKSRGQEDLVV